MPPLPACRAQWCGSCWRSRSSERGSALTAKPFARQVVRAAYRTTVGKRRTTATAESLVLRVVAPAFRTAHISPIERLYAQLIEQRLGIFQIGGIEALSQPVVDFTEHHARLVATVG